LVIIDQIGRLVTLDKKPQRVVSLVPSMTELAIDLGGAKNIVGRTKFCIHPEETIKNITKIGGTKNPRIDDIIALKPDLILANKEENIKEHIQQLESHAPVYISNVKTLENNLDMIADLGQLFQNSSRAFDIIEKTEAMQLDMKIKSKKTAAYVIWKDPYMVAGGDTYINAMIEALGFTNIYKADLRYPQKSVADFIASKVDYIFLSSEPYPFTQKHIEYLKAENVLSKIILVDGEFFSWYGNRILKKKNYLKQFMTEI